MDHADASALDVNALNARRKRAVQLRVDGLSLTRIQAETGLSVPTIIKAYKAFEGGGWSAIEVAARGRPKGEGRVLAPEAEAALREAVLQGPPEAVGLPAGLWDAAAIQAFSLRRWQVALEARSVSRLLARWGLSVQPLRETAQQDPDAQRWWQEVWMPAQGLASRPKTAERLLWMGALAHPQRPAPAGLLVAVCPRGTLRWLPVAQMARATAYQDFLARLPALRAGNWHVFLAGPDLSRAPELTAWMSAQAHLRVEPCPVQPQSRALAEPQPEPSLKAPVALLPAAPPARASAPAMPQRVARSFFSTPQPVHPPEERDHPMSLTHLQRLEAESIHIMREVVAEAENPVMLYSIGKDSAVMLHLAKKAFFPSPPPFPLLHVDTTWKFRAMYEMRDRMAKELGMDLLVHHNPEAKELGINPFTHGSQIHTDMWKTQGLKQALDKYNFDAAFGGARRDEEKSRAKERIFSFRSAQHRWDPKNQRPELWRLYNGRKQKGESIRVFPISNWTELDIWQYIYLENVPIVPLYFAAKRPVVDRDGTLIMVDDERFPLREGEVPMMKNVRFRTLGCYPLSGAVESEADTLPAIIQEMLLTKTSERQGRMIDHDAAASMEKKKQEGYF
ncbi:sulfate adenylyltransferase subunit CysD [Ideonella paludis]|uniref:Sulfate adenylyltransferase subunit 2 n=2 Tax=Ideonella paludis TaxID=1233411 RepID=A0ABS5DRV4_9BURK|nr:sulfate adenylyltransferase subunit CysD [Ideonella paludis]